MMKLETGAACALALALTFAGPALAQDQVDQLLKPTPAAPAAVNDGEAYHRADDSEQDPVEVRTTQALNDEIASRNTLAENQERADQVAFEAERARHEQLVAQSLQARLDYEEALRQADDARRRWEADQARWEADVRACQAGDRLRCGPPRY
ncbi:MAG: cell wall hydrolase [Alphaproteobacteria bacterium]|nr:cell wall hydrolase [Alphaproteobacteria bacterium]MBU2377898.1 cell wall hydrolase [Alphaproteobacteria bacterium]